MVTVQNLGGNKSVGIHQPNFLPWIGLIHKIFICDEFVFLDNVQFSRNQYQQRNTIMTANGPVQLTVPVEDNKGGKLINEIKISERRNWRRKHLHSIYFAYKKAPYFNEFYEMLESCYNRNDTLLIDLNLRIFNAIFDYLQMKPTVFFSSELDVSPGKTERLVDICIKRNATTYVYGGTADYMDRRLFSKKHIRLVPQNFSHPTYEQLHTKTFTPCLSIIDWIFTTPKSRILSFLEIEKERFRNESKEYHTVVQ